VLLLVPPLLKLQEYAPTCIKLMDPPYEFTPLDEYCTLVMLKALQLEHAESLTCTETSLAAVAPHVLLLVASSLKLQEYAPTCIKLMDPPYEFAPLEYFPLVMLKALQLEHAEPLTCTETSLTVVAPHVLLLVAGWPQLQEYAPTCKLMDPPYEFAPADESPLLSVDALTLIEEAFWKRTRIPVTFVEPHVLMLFPPLKPLLLHAYEPTWKENDPPYTFAPCELEPPVSLAASHDWNRAVSKETLTLRTTVSPTAATVPSLREYTDEYAPMCNATAPP
jgi:hypothetical protein